MTLLLLGVGAIAAVLGTRAAGLAFIGAAILGGTGALPAAATWTAATAGGLVALRASPRRLALPVLGAAAALGVGTARNTAVVAALWVLGTAAAVLARGPGSRAISWALSLCAADLPVIAAVGWTALKVGFEGWPGRLDVVAVSLLLAAALLRVGLTSGPDDDRQEPGLLVVRTQSVILLAIALGAPDLGDGLLTAVVVLGAAGFAAGGCFRRAATRDAVQELTLLALVAAGARAGWGPGGWEWGVLAGGTLIHDLRLRLSVRGSGPVAAALLGGGGLGLPLLPALLVALEGSLRAPRGAGVAILAGLVAGMGARAAVRWSIEPVVEEDTGWSSWVAAAFISGALLVGLWAPVLTVPRPPAAAAIPWPPVWGSGLVVLAAAAALLGPRSQPDLRRAPVRLLLLPDLRLPEHWAAERVVMGSVAGLAAAAVAFWVLGVLRGFL